MIRAELEPDVCRCGEPLDGASFHDDVDGEQTCEMCCHTCSDKSCATCGDSQCVPAVSERDQMYPDMRGWPTDEWPDGEPLMPCHTCQNAERLVESEGEG